MCGLNDFGQLGLSKEKTAREVLPILLDSVSDVKEVRTGIFHSMVLNKAGEVYSFGDNTFGQLGVGIISDYETLGGGRGGQSDSECVDYRDAPTKVDALRNIVKIASGHHSAALTQSGKLYFWGTGSFGVYPTPQEVADLDFVDVSIGGCFGAAVDREGLLWSWGSNS